MGRAIVFSEYGDADVLRLVEVDDPVPADGQVRVRVRAAGVNPVDHKGRSGMFGNGTAPEAPQRIGNEYAGVVDLVGPGVTGLAPGDEVLGSATQQCYADHVVIAAEDVVRKPASMPWEVAAGLPAVGQTAYNALRQLEVRAGETVLIHAAAGGVGTIAVQLAVAWGATVIGTASERNHEYLRSLGAIPVRYGEGLADRVRAVAANGVQVALDLIGGEAVAVSLELVADRGRIGTTADPAAPGKYGIRRVGGRSTEYLRELVDWYARGRLRLPIARVFPLAEAARAHREVETGHVRGKIVLQVSEG